MESPEIDNAVFRPSHKPWKSIKPIPTFPLSRQPRDIYEKIPKRRRPKLPAPTGPFRLILGLEKTGGIDDFLDSYFSSITRRHIGAARTRDTSPATISNWAS